MPRDRDWPPLADRGRRLKHLSHPVPARTFGTQRPRVGCHQAGTRPPEPLHVAFPTASRSLFPQLLLQAHRRRVGGEGRQTGGHVGIWELAGKGASLAEGPVCPGAVWASGLCLRWENRGSKKGKVCPHSVHVQIPDSLSRAELCPGNCNVILIMPLPLCLQTLSWLPSTLATKLTHCSTTYEISPGSSDLLSPR